MLASKEVVNITLSELDGARLVVTAANNEEEDTIPVSNVLDNVEGFVVLAEVSMMADDIKSEDVLYDVPSET